MLTDPLLWSVLPHQDRNSWIDFLGQHDLWHRDFDRYMRSVRLADPFTSLPLGDGGRIGWEDPEDDVYPPSSWHDAHQAVHEGEAAAAGLVAPIDFRSYDLRGADEFATYTYLHALEHQRLRQAVGL